MNPQNTSDTTQENQTSSSHPINLYVTRIGHIGNAGLLLVRGKGSTGYLTLASDNTLRAIDLQGNIIHTVAVSSIRQAAEAHKVLQPGNYLVHANNGTKFFFCVNLGLAPEAATLVPPVLGEAGELPIYASEEDFFATLNSAIHNPQILSTENTELMKRGGQSVNSTFESSTTPALPPAIQLSQEQKIETKKSMFKNATAIILLAAVVGTLALKNASAIILVIFLTSCLIAVAVAFLQSKSRSNKL